MYVEDYIEKVKERYQEVKTKIPVHKQYDEIDTLFVVIKEVEDTDVHNQESADDVVMLLRGIQGYLDEVEKEIPSVDFSPI